MESVCELLPMNSGQISKEQINKLTQEKMEAFSKSLSKMECLQCERRQGLLSEKQWWALVEMQYIARQWAPSVWIVQCGYHLRSANTVAWEA